MIGVVSTFYRSLGCMTFPDSMVIYLELFYFLFVFCYFTFFFLNRSNMLTLGVITAFVIPKKAQYFYKNKFMWGTSKGPVCNI